MPRTEPWTIKRVLDWTSGYLERKGDEHPRLSAEWLLANVCGLSRVELYVNFDKPLEAGELDAMHAAIERRAAGEPLQYVTGEMPFRHIVLKCERGVLIPRPETEVLVDAALEGVDAAAEKGDEEVGPVRVLEVGTGTGCIALSIASERPGTLVTATDLSPRAAELAARNREALGLEEAVDIIECDLASGVDPDLMGSFSVLVSNPPYIPTSVLAEEVPAEVTEFEPHLALDGGTDGLDIFRRLVNAAPSMLKPGGLFACELHETTLDAAAEICRRAGFERVRIARDLAGRPRFVLACVPEPVVQSARERFARR